MTPGIDVLDSIVICDDASDQQAPVVSYGDTVFLVSWLDKRGAFPAIYSARIRRDGTVIEQNGFILHADSMSQISPVSAFDGTNFLVAWIGFDTGGFGVYAKRVSPAGTVLDSLPIELCYDPTPKYNPAVSFGGNSYLVIWDDARLTGTEYDEWCARISSEGVLLDSNSIPVDTSPGYQYNPSVTYLPPYFLAVWTDEQSGDADLVGKRVDTNGTVIEHAAIPVSGDTGVQLNAALCTDSEFYFVSWEDGRNGYDQKDIYGTFIDSAGAGLAEEKMAAGGRQGITLTVAPNPFSGKVIIRFGPYAQAGHLEIRIFDICGRMVKKHTVGSTDAASRQTFLWNAKNEQGYKVPAGIYFIVVGEGTAQRRKKLLLLK